MNLINILNAIKDAAFFLNVNIIRVLNPVIMLYF